MASDRNALVWQVSIASNARLTNEPQKKLGNGMVGSYSNVGGNFSAIPAQVTNLTGVKGVSGGTVILLP
jgi:hypothetical protein